VGPVFRGEDPANRQPVVVKVLRVGLAPERVAIIASALALARERLAPHPALCPMLDSGVHDAEPFVVSAFVDGDSLDVALREYGPANITDALPRMRALADALDSAATAGVTHGSLHLRDIIVSPEHTVLTGIAIAAVLERVGVRPPVRRPYCAPEIAQGHGVSPAGDQFALAAIAHEWLSGRRIAGPGGEGFHLPGTSAAGTEAVAAVFCRALDEAPEARFPTATAFVDALAEVSDALAPRARVAKRRPVPTAEPRLAFDFLEDGAVPETPVGPRPDPGSGADDADTEPAALSFATLDDDTDVVPPDPPDEDEADTDGDAAPPHEANDAAAADAVAAFEATAPIHDSHPMVDVMAAAPVDVTGPLIDLPDNPRPTEPVRAAAPPIIVRPPRVRPAAPTPMDEAPSAAAPYDSTSDDESPSGWSPARWALVLVTLTALAVGGGTALVRWGAPSSGADVPAPAETSSAASSTPPAAATPPEAAAQPSTSSPAPAPTPTARPDSAAPAGAPVAGAATGGASDRPPALAVTPPTRPAPAPAARPTPPKSAPAQAPTASSRPPAPKAPPPRPAAVGSLLVRSSPSGAEVFVDGARRGVTPLAVRDLPLGAHAVRVARPGFAAAEQRVTLDAGRPSRAIDVALGRPAAAAAAPVAASTPGILVIESRPAGARVLIDGREHGRTPVTVPALPPGDYAVAISLAGYQPITTTTRVEPGARARVAVSLTLERPQ
jgi:serine/threonine protein kinase